jgi:hypothetical protein
MTWLGTEVPVPILRTASCFIVEAMEQGVNPWLCESWPSHLVSYRISIDCKQFNDDAGLHPPTV